MLAWLWLWLWSFGFLSFVSTYTHFEFDVIEPYKLLCSNARFSAIEML
jgi:hypothetical protein